MAIMGTAKLTVESVSNTLEFLENWAHGNLWALIEILLITAGCYLINRLIARFLNKLYILSKRTDTFWDESLVMALDRPIKVSIWLIGATFMFDAINHQIQMNFLKFSPIIRKVVIALMISWVIIRFVNAFEHNLIKNIKKEKGKLDKSTVDFAIKLTKFAVFSIAALAILESFGFNISGIIALGGIGGAALAFAGQNMLSNFFGTLILYMDKPFVIGDKIWIKGENIRGDVEEIGWRMSLIRTSDQVPVYVQNAVFARDSIINYSRVTHRRVSERIGVVLPSVDALDAIIKDIEDLLATDKKVDKDYKILAALQDFGQDFVELKVSAVLCVPDLRDFALARAKILVDIYKILKDHGCSVLFSNKNKSLLAR